LRCYARSAPYKEALDAIRLRSVGEKIVFYGMDADGQLRVHAIRVAGGPVQLVDVDFGKSGGGVVSSFIFNGIV